MAWLGGDRCGHTVDNSWVSHTVTRSPESESHSPVTGGGDRSWSQERSGSQPGALESSHSSPLSVPPILSSRRVKRLHPSEEFVQQPLLIEVNKKFHSRNGSISTFFTYKYMNVKIKIFENTDINIIFICIVYFTNLSFRNGKVDKKN